MSDRTIDVSDKNNNTMPDMSDMSRCVGKNEKNPQDMSDRARGVDKMATTNRLV